MYFKLRSFGTCMFILLILLSGCTEKVKISGEEIINNVIDSEGQVQDYYGEAVLTIKEDKKIVSNIKLKEYVKGNNRKIIMHDQRTKAEIKVLQVGQDVTYYDNKKKEAKVMHISDEQMHFFSNVNPKDQFKQALELMRDSHEHEIMKEEKILDYSTYHMRLTAKDRSNLIGDMDIWVDQKTWMVLKIESESSNSIAHVSYTKLDFSPKFPKNTFSLDLPKDVDVETISIEGIDNFIGKNSTEITIEEASHLIGGEFLLFENNELELNSVKKNDLTDSSGYYEVELQYNRDQAPFCQLTVFPVSKDEQLTLDDLGKPMNIREQDVYFKKSSKSYFWDEAGLRYVMKLLTEDYKEDDVKQFIEGMSGSTNIEKSQ